MSSFGQVVISQNEPKLLGSVETWITLKLQLHDILSHSNSHNNVASIQKNRGDKSDRVIVA